MKQSKKVYLTAALVLTTCGILFQNCAAAPPPDIGQLTSASNSVGAFTCSFAGQILTDGQSVTAYQASSVAAGGNCVSQTRTCNNGMLSGSYANGSCVVQSASGTASCNFYGQTIPHGGAVTAFQASSVVGGSCNSQSRVCTNGTLSGTYQYTSCVVDCSFNGAVVAHGNSVTAFLAPSAASCSSQTRSCNMGTLSGSYAYSSCSTGSGSSCNFNGQTIAHGASVTAYSTDLAPAGTTCAAYDQVRTCSNGVLSGSFPYSSCVRDFTDPCGGQVPLQKAFSEAITQCP